MSAPYIWKQCPEESLAGKQSVMNEMCCTDGVCGSDELETVFASLAYWTRDMGTQISGTANYWAYSNTMRGQYYTEINWSGNLTAPAAALCNFAPRTFKGGGAKQKFTFTRCVPCPSGDEEHRCCRGFDMGLSGFQCPCYECDQAPTHEVTFSTKGWQWWSGGDFGALGPTYNNSIFWKVPVFTMGPVSTGTCFCSPNEPGWGYFGTRCKETVYATWSGGEDSFQFTVNWFWENDPELFPDGYCWRRLGGKECCGDPPGPGASDEEQESYANCTECSEGPHDIWQRGGFSVTINKGAPDAQRCPV